MPGDQRMHYVECLTWDAKAGKYRSWMFDDWGNRGEGWMTFDEDGVTAHSQATMISPTGDRTRGMGTMKLKGTMTREP